MNRHTDDELRAFGEELGRYRAVTAPATLRRDLRRDVLTREVPARAPRLSFARLRPALAAAVVAIALVSASGVAAASSLPGDPAFALKRGVETVQLAFATSDAARVELLVAQSDRRLDELQEAFAHRSDAVPAATSEYASAVAALGREIGKLALAEPSSERDAALEAAAASSEKHQAVLAALLERVPDEAKPGIQKAIDAQNDVHGKSDGAPKSEPSAGPSTTPSHPTPVRPSQSPGRR